MATEARTDTGERVLDVGAGDNPDPRATETADVRDEAPTDYHFDAAEPWPLRDGVYDRIIMSHVVEHLDDESTAIHAAADCLRPGGILEIRAPIGGNAIGDHTHERVWNPGRALNYCQTGAKPWHDPPPLVLSDCQVRPSWWGPFGAPGVRHLLTAIGDVWPDWAARHASGGELVVTYRRLDDR